MANKRPHVTEELIQAIAAYIRAGGYPEVAAEAAGVPRAVFRRWLRQGRQAKTRSACRKLVEAVRQAQAQARLAAEVAAFKDRPLDWLKSGPGKAAADRPGWTGPVKPTTASSAPAAALADPNVARLCTQLLELLAPFPEARAALAEFLASAKS